MGRELKRVPLDFKWPINQLWKGYYHPFKALECKACDRSGKSPAYKKLSDDWYAFDKPNYVDLGNGRRFNDNAWQYHLTELEVAALVIEGRLSDLMDKWYHYNKEQNQWEWCDREKREWIKCDQPTFPTPEVVNDWAKKTMGHDACNQWICVKARGEALGIVGDCEYCNGKGEYWFSEEIEKMSEEIKNYDPPTGDGYQLWSTTTEGNPMSPVFETLEELCQYLEDENVSLFGSNTSTKEKWFEMLRDDKVFHQEGNMIFI